jgi:hypothetical protein
VRASAAPAIATESRLRLSACEPGHRHALQAYLGHRNIQHTVRYTELSPTRFKNLWRDWTEWAAKQGVSERIAARSTSSRRVGRKQEMPHADQPVL